MPQKQKIPMKQTAHQREFRYYKRVDFVHNGKCGNSNKVHNRMVQKPKQRKRIQIFLPDHNDKASMYTINITIELNYTHKDHSTTISLSSDGTDITVTDS